VPYSVKSLSADSLSAACTGCVTDAQIAAVAGSKITGTIPASSLPDAGFIRNTTTQQASSNFNISGNGMAGGTLSGNIVNATTQFSLGSSSVLRLGAAPNDLFIGSNAGPLTSTANNTGGNTLVGNETGQVMTNGNLNTFLGWRAGRANTSGSENTFLGVGAGELNTTGIVNTFLGFHAGYSNATGNFNSFFGHQAGESNMTGSLNAFTGYRSGRSNVGGTENTFVGVGAGEFNTFGNVNTFVGRAAGSSNTTGANNTFVGTFSGNQNTTGTANTTLGYSANILLGVSNATAIGASARADCSNCLVLGSVNGVNGATASANVGIGTTAPVATLHVSSGADFLSSQLVLNQTRTNDYVRLSLRRGGNRAWEIAANPDELNFFDAAGNTNLVSLQRASRQMDIYGSLHVDAGDSNNGGLINSTINNAVVFGGSISGEGISSKRTAGGNQFGMDFYANRIIRMSITNAGNVGIGTTQPMTALHLPDNGVQIGFSATVSDNFHWAADTFNGPRGFRLYNGNYGFGIHLMTALPSGNIGIGTTNPSAKLHVIGNILASGTITPSDQRYKQNVATLHDALSKLRQLRGVSYDWKQAAYPEMQFAAGSQLGFIAQEVEQVLPEAVHKTADGMYGMNYSAIIPLLVEAIKEQQQEADKRQQELEQIKNQNAQLLEQTEALKKANAAIEARLAAIEKLLQQTTPAKKQD
ncbi:MAG TPA: tail fiber domain-containing protein, partial [Blastocatellia bacterium]|nr:tail fiber domain-containing protein [Blastocatellia bacterium]